MSLGQRQLDAVNAKRKELGRQLSPIEVVAILDDVARKFGKERKRSAIHPDAESIYETYPKKVARDDALRAISKALEKVTVEYLRDKTNQFAMAVRSWPSSYRYFADGGDRCPHPATWFNAGRYADAPTEWKRQGAKTSAPHQRVSKPEPEGWREAFPDFVDRDKGWQDLQPAQQEYITAAMRAGTNFSEPIKQIELEQKLREA